MAESESETELPFAILRSHTELEGLSVSRIDPSSGESGSERRGSESSRREHLVEALLSLGPVDVGKRQKKRGIDVDGALAVSDPSSSFVGSTCSRRPEQVCLLPALELPRMKKRKSALSRDPRSPSLGLQPVDCCDVISSRMYLSEGIQAAYMT